MTIRSIFKDAFRVALKAKALWLFGFFVVLGSGSSGGGGGGGGGGGPPVVAVGALPLPVLLVLGLAVVAASAIVMTFLSEGALIEGVKRHVRGETLSVRQGFRDGAMSIGVVFLIKLTYLAACAVSVLLLALPFVLVTALADVNALAVGIAVVAVVVAVPWLLTLYMWHAFALRIAVLENRRTIDAIKKARLFLHGRILLGLKLMAANLVGTFIAVLVALAILGPVVLLAVVAMRAFGVLTLVATAPVVLAVFFVCVAVAGSFQSAVWTLGYLDQVEA